MIRVNPAPPENAREWRRRLPPFPPVEVPSPIPMGQLLYPVSRFSVQKILWKLRVLTPFQVPFSMNGIMAQVDVLFSTQAVKGISMLSIFSAVYFRKHFVR